MKIDSLNKIKRVRDVPDSFSALKQAVEAQLRDHDQFKNAGSDPSGSQPRIYSI